MKVGYIGLGAMGGALASRLLGKVELSVFDLNSVAVAQMVAAGSQAAESASALAAACDVIFLCLPRSADVEQTIFGPHGLAVGLTAGKLVIDQTSGIPAVTAGITKCLAAKGIHMIDAPVAGGVPAAKAGTVTIMGSGTDEAWAIAEPVMQHISPKIYRCSDRVGDGQAMKLVNNAIGAGYRVSTLEIAALGRKFGLPLKDIADRLNAGAAINFTTRGMLAALVEGRSTTNFSMVLMVKDMNEALLLGAAAGVAAPLTAAARSMMQTCVNLVGKNASVEDIIPTTEKLSGVPLTSELLDPLIAVPNGETLERVSAAIERAVELCNQIVVGECAAIGAGFGLTPGTMSTVLNAGSAWSKASERLLPDMAQGEVANLPGSFIEMATNLRLISRLAMLAGVPAVLPQAALAVVETARRQFGDSANPGRLASMFGR